MNEKQAAKKLTLGLEESREAARALGRGETYSDEDIDADDLLDASEQFCRVPVGRYSW